MRYLKQFTAFFLAFLLFTGSVSFAASYPITVKSAKNVNMRRSPSSTSTVLEQVNAGDAVTILGESGSYYHIEYRGRDGYAMKVYIDGETVTAVASAAVSSTDDYPYVTTTNGRANLRQGADTSARILTTLDKGAYVTVTGVKGTFSSVSYGSITGYIATSLLNKNSSSNSSSVTAPAGTIRQGTKGTAAATVQTRLAELGYYTGKIDGNFGSGSVAALQAFQRRNTLNADGICGTATKTVLFGSKAIPAASVTPAPTPTPTATLILPTASPAPVTTPKTYSRPSGTVRKGTQGNDALLVQQRLKDLGYYTGSLDGNFGTGSVEALKDFQQKNHLDIDGACGNNTAALLFTDGAIPKNPATAAPMVIITQENCVTIKTGISGIEVLRLQQRLTELGFYSARMDGNFMADDMAAVRAFQTANNLKCDGVAGYATQALLFSDRAHGPIVATPVPTAVPTSAPTAVPGRTNATLRFGSNGTDVKTMQQNLIGLGYLSGSADGVYGNMTKQAVAAFQSANGLTSDGVAGNLTLTRLYSGSAIAAGKSSPTVIATSTVVRSGDRGDAVKELQTRLIELGYLSGKADGIFGLATLQALKSFQKANNLTADGIAGSKTWSSLKASNAKPTSAPNVKPTATPKPADPYAVTTTVTSSIVPVASKVQYANWYKVTINIARAAPYVTLYDPATGISWNAHIFSCGKHADCEPMTAADTSKMIQAFGGKTTWTPKVVWVIFSTGDIFIATTHDTPHGIEHRENNNFDGHCCIHFPRTASEVEEIGPYATSHQTAVDKGWATLQANLK